MFGATVVATELPDYLSDFKDVFSRREASILSEDMDVEHAIMLTIQSDGRIARN